MHDEQVDAFAGGFVRASVRQATQTSRPYFVERLHKLEEKSKARGR
jgi:hypothetical protein